MKLIVHPGIGDICWVISKLCTTGRQFDLVIAKDSKTKRSMPLVDMIPCIRSAEYGGMELYSTLAQCGNAEFADYIKAEEEGKDLYMTANSWLEDGKRIEGFLPDLETDYHYPIMIPEKDIIRAKSIVKPHYRTFGIYTSSRGGIDNWEAWTEYEWLEFIRNVYNSYPNTMFILIGATWDMDMRLPMVRALESEHIPYIDLFGKTTLPQAVSLIKQMDYFAGFASGLTILSDAVNKPVLMLYPKHLNKMMHAWPDPANIANGVHQAHLWDRPVPMFKRIKSVLDQYLR